jgi:PKD repeat protein
MRTVGALGVARASAAVAVLPSGEVLVAGGTGAGGRLAAVDRIDETATTAAPGFDARDALGAPNDVVTLTGRGLLGAVECSDTAPAEVPIVRLLDDAGVLRPLPATTFSSTTATVRVPGFVPAVERIYVSVGGVVGGLATRILPPRVSTLPMALSTTTAPADGVATIDVDIGPVLDVGNQPVHEDTPLTLTADGAVVLTADADTASPGTQLHARDGRVLAQLRAPTRAGVVAVRVVAADSPVEANATVTFTPGPPVGIGAVTLAPTTLRADGVDPATITVGPVVDAFGNAVADGTLVALTTSAGRLQGNDASPAVGLQVATTGGLATATLVAATVSGAFVVTATVTPAVLGSASGSFIAGAAAGAIALAASPPSLPADGASTTSLAVGPVVDARNNLVDDGTLVTLTTTAGALLGVDAAPTTAGLQLALRAGRATALLSSSTTPTTARVDAAVGAALGTVDVDFRPPEPPAGPLQVVLAPARIDVGAGLVQGVVDGIVSQAGVPLLDQAIFTIESTLGAVVSDDVAPGLAGVQVRSTGPALAFLVDGGTAAGTGVVTVRSVIGTAVGSASFEVVAGAVDHVVLRAPRAATAGEPARVEVVPVDRFDNPVDLVGVVVDVCVTTTGALGAGTLVAASASSLPAGGTLCGGAAPGAFVTVTSEVVGPLAVDVAAPTLPHAGRGDAGTIVVFGAGPPDRIVLTAPAAPQPACGRVSVDLVVVDRLGNPTVPDASLPLRVSTTSPRGAPAVTATNLVAPTTLPAREVTGLLPADGRATVEVTLDAIGNLDVAVAAALPAASAPVTIPFVTGPLDVDASAVEALADTVLAGSGAVPIEVIPEDSCGVRLGAGLDVVVTTTIGAVDPVVAAADGRYLTTLRVPAGVCPTEPAVIAARVGGTALTTVARVAARCATGGEAPVIARNANATAARGVPYVYDDDRRITASGTPPLSFSLVEGPAGMVVGATGGRLDWLPLDAGPVDVTVKVENPAGFDVYAFTIDVAATAPRAPEAAFLLVPPEGPAPLAVTADGTGSVAFDGAQLLAWRWDFGDGSPGAFGERATHTYARPGGRVARLIVVDNLGGTGAASGIVRVVDGDAVPAAARIVTSVVDGGPPLRAGLRCDCTAGTNPILAVDWDFGDGNTARGLEVEHAFAPGSWEVQLTVTDAAGLAAVDRTTVTVGGLGLPPALVVQASPVAGPAPLTVQFDADASDLDGTIAAVTWDFGDGGRADGERVERTFAEPGLVRAVVTATDDAGLTATASLEIAVTDADGRVPPVFVSSPQTTARVGEPWVYDDDGIPSARGDRALVWSVGKQVAGEAFGAPAGMTVDPQTGRLRWTPERGGQIPVVLVVQNPAGAAVQEFTVDVVGGDDDGDGEAPATGCGCTGSTAGGATGDVRGDLLLLALVVCGRRRRR